MFIASKVLLIPGGGVSLMDCLLMLCLYIILEETFCSLHAMYRTVLREGVV